MLIVIGVWFALAGGVAALAGLTGMRRARRLRRGGSPVGAVALPGPVSVGEEPGGSPGRTVIQYTLADGRVVERPSPRVGQEGGDVASRPEGARLVRP